MGNKGWISLHRKIEDNWLYPTVEDRTFSKFEAWVDILLMVNHEDRKVMLGRDLIEVKKGQRITSLRKLARRWKWSRNKVSSFLELLDQDNMIELKKDTKKTVITVVNYEVYQNDDVGKRTAKGQQKDTKGTRKDTNNNDNNDNNDNKNNNVREKPVRSKYNFEQHHLKLAKLLFKKMKENNPNAKEPNFDSWANTFRLMMERDKREGKEIQEVILWSQQHHFWCTNILSANKLREQFDRLTLQMSDDGLKVVNGNRKEVIPDWFKNRNDRADNKTDQNLTSEQAEKERQELADMISKYS